MEWGDTIIVIFVILATAVIMFVFPMMTMADKADDVAQLAVQSATVDFVNEIKVTKKITLEQYESFIEEISATGNAYDVEIEVQKLDENASKKATQVSSDKVGENTRYSEYFSQIWSVIDDGGTYNLKEGDLVFVKVKNASPSLYQQLVNLGNDNYAIVGEDGGMV